MHKRTMRVWVCAALLAAGTAVAHDAQRSSPAAGAEDRAPGYIERGLARLERAVARLEARLAGRGGAMMDGCADMMGDGMMSSGSMMSGGMMGGSQPNERWRSSR